MPTFSEAVQESGRLALCALFAGNEAVNALLSPLTGDSLGLYPLTSGLRRKLCSDDPGNDPIYEAPFTGGQCEGTLYQIEWTVNAPGAAPSPQISDRPGPLTLSRALEPGDAEIECDEEAMMWQEDAEQPESEDYEISKYEFDKILKNKGEVDELLDEIEDFLSRK